MNVLLISSLFVAAVVVLLQLIWTLRFCSILRTAQSDSTGDDAEIPNVLVILSLRGADPSLPKCMQGLLQQNYPHYDVRVVVDCSDDPAWDVVQREIQQAGGRSPHVTFLKSRLDSCSLKLSALIQELSRIDDSYGAVVLLDADTIPYKNWLRDMVAPFADPKVGVVSGIRWYFPTEGNWGTVVRCIWNAAAVVQMNAFKIPWGGSLAIKSDVLRSGNLLDIWSTSFVEDVYLFHVAQRLGLRFVFAPAVMSNHESTDLFSCVRFVRRQMFSVRLYHSSWPLHVLWAFVSTLAQITLAGICLTASASGDSNMAVWSGGGLFAYWLGLATQFFYLERSVCRAVSARGDATSTLPLKGVIAGNVAMLMYLVCISSAAFIRKIEWRGITYDVTGPWNVRLLEYRPYNLPMEAGEVSIK